MNKSALVLEGGGMRGAYTAGVLDFLLEKGMEFDSIYGVSAGALTGGNYKSRQIGRGLRTLASYLQDERYSGPQYLMKTGDWFNIDFSYNQIPNELDKVDYDTFDANPVNFYSVVSNVETGKAEYIKITDLRKQMDRLRASATLPLLSNIVEYDGKKYLDGGSCDSIPLKKSMEDGHNKNLVILTQHRGFTKKPSANRYACRVMYKEYPNFVKAMDNRHYMYNRQLKLVYEMEKKGKVFVIQPADRVDVARLEKNPARLVELYHQGKMDAANSYERLVEYMNK